MGLSLNLELPAARAALLSATEKLAENNLCCQAAPEMNHACASGTPPDIVTAPGTPQGQDTS